MKYSIQIYRDILSNISHRVLSFICIALMANISNLHAQDQELPVIEATTPIQINADLPVFGDVTDFQISPDNQRAVYISDQNNDEVFELFSVRMDGSAAPIRLSLPTPVVNGDVLSVVGFSADGERVIYSADQNLDGMDEILSARLDGSARITLTPNFGAVNAFRTLSLSPDKARVLYVPSVQGARTLRHMFSVSVTGGAIERLSDNFAVNQILTASDPDFSRDSSKVIYRVVINGEDQLHIASTDGSGTALRLDADGPGLDRIFAYEISNDNSRVVYHADQITDAQFELFSVAATGGQVVRLNSSLPADAEVQSFRLNSLNSNFVYYIADQFALGRHEMFSVDIAGGTPVRISPNITGDSDAAFRSTNLNGPIIGYVFNDMSAPLHVLSFRGIVQADNRDLFLSVNTALLDFFAVTESESGEFVTFISSPSGTFEQRLSSLRLDSNQRVLISQETTRSNASDLRHISRNDKTLAYTTSDDINFGESRRILFVTSLRFGEPVRLTPDLIDDAEISKTLTSDDAAFVLYQADQDALDQFNLYASAITVNEPDPELSELCFPIVAATGGIAVICL